MLLFIYVKRFKNGGIICRFSLHLHQMTIFSFLVTTLWMLFVLKLKGFDFLIVMIKLSREILEPKLV